METNGRKIDAGNGIKLEIDCAKIIERRAVSSDAVNSDYVWKDKSNCPSSFLSLVSGGEEIMIEALDGEVGILGVKKTSKIVISEDFENWGLYQSGPATPEALLDVSEMINDGTFTQIFTDITGDFDKICLTQNQIIRFCEKHPNWLRQGGCATFFLTKVKKEYLVVHVFLPRNCLFIRVSRLGCDNIWRGEFRRRVVTRAIRRIA
jgi:hypothetical protein